jgi:ribosomal protein S18 acetylase RimI-like enzyme
MSERKGDMSDEYGLVPATSVDKQALIDFAAAVWPQQTPPYRVASSWWTRAGPECAVAAVHRPTGAMAGLCGGRPCTWSIAGQSLPAVAICDWYVSPAHAGKGIGKRLVAHFDAPDRFLYAFSISDAAIANFKKLGWQGPYASSIMLLPLPGIVTIALRFAKHGGDLTFYDREIAGGEPLDDLGAALDAIDAAREAPAHMRRGAVDWSWRLSVCGERRYRFCLARRAGKPVGYVVVRRMMPGRSPRMDKLKPAIVTDLVAVDDDRHVLRALALKAVEIASELQATLVLTATTTASHRKALAGVGFISPAWPVIGPLLARRSPQFMWRPWGPAATLKATDMTLTFADVAIDLDL